MSKTLLITGGAGYIGSHFIEALYESRPDFLSDVKLVLVDNLSSGQGATLLTLNALASAQGFSVPRFYQADLLDEESLHKIFAETHPDAVLHFAAKISVAESVAKPDLYFENNVIGSQKLLNAMKRAGCKRMVFSSTAAVYGKVEDPKKANLPIDESTPLKPINPYGKTKVMMEEAIQAAHQEWGLNSVIFRYFNAAGASIQGRLGECHEPETHLVPLLVRAALSGNEFQVFGAQYETRDGSCIRDYVHVKDLAEAHLLGLKRLFATDSERSVFNLGSSRGNSVMEVVEAIQVITGKNVRTKIMPNRAGDSATLIADSQKARTELGWMPRFSSMHDILKTVLNWEGKSSARPH